MNAINHIITTNLQSYKLSELLQTNDTIANRNQPLELIITLASNITATLIDDLAAHGISTVNLTVTAATASSLDLYGNLSSKLPLIERFITIKLTGANAHANVFYAGTATKSQIVKINSKQHHTTANTSSNLAVKMVLNNAATLICNALIQVAPGAEQVNATQVNKNLLLSPQATATSSPKLEVLSHQVKCSHGAAMSYLDTEKLFFLQSRGLSKGQAKKLLIRSFLQR